MLDIDALRPFLNTTLESTDFKNLGQKYTGKVRDVYIQSKKCHPELDEGRRILIATDRQSAFDRLWCTIPLKGQVLTQISAWWFEKVKDIMPTHILAVPDPNVMVVKDLHMIPIEIVVRGYLTGSTKTSAWVNYEKGIRNFCGNPLPDGMVKNQPFDAPIITPTTKSEDDELIDPTQIIERGLATKQQWEEITEKAFALFAHGQQIAAKHGLILVDTKYEMGLDEHGILTLADEVHTPDSSRYWIQDTTDSLDKEFFRLWLKEQGFEYGKPPPKVTDEIRLELAQKYIDLFERITGKTFVLPPPTDPTARIKKNLAKWQVS
ncbi:phosphoribosylaminoimidazolesuccinocarboxamide synthase [Candidatus Peregrinibacteria bacterium]|nr:phosphoribosylaminoimidazolesuccinocarboxamide synthase [Candidatus Peregrinibacteria bacterium]